MGRTASWLKSPSGTQGCMSKATSLRGGGSRFEVCETQVVAPPGLQFLQTADAARSPFAQRYLAYRHPLQFSCGDPGNRCDTYYLSPWMVMAVVDVASIDRFESPLQGQDILEFHYRISGAIEIAGSWGECRVLEPAWLVWLQRAGRGAGVILCCARGWLGEVNERAAVRLDAALGPHEYPRLSPRYRTGPHIGATLPLLRDIVRADRADPLHWLYACANANELLYVTLSNMSTFAPAGEGRLKLTGRDRRQLHVVRDTLAADFF